MTKQSLHEVSITPAGWPDDLAVVRELFLEYQDRLGEPVCFNDFEAELDDLPGAYSLPTGVLLLAHEADSVVGLVGVVPYEGETSVCEIKRLYVLPRMRGAGIGQALAVAALEFAREAGYASVRLKTLLRLDVARGIYKGLGFRDVTDGSGLSNESPVVMQRNFADDC